MKLWGGRFTKATAKDVEAFTQSISFDHELAKYDILGSMAHAKMLYHCNLLSQPELQQITRGLIDINKRIENNNVQFSIIDEDIHLNIEKLLHRTIGAAALKLHTARSRNDQVALDLHLFLREKILVLIEKNLLLQKALLQKAKQHQDVIMPGYTHLQRAQPIYFSHHLLAYVSMLQRDLERLKDCWPRVNISPLGAGAIATTTLAIDRNYVAEILGFDEIYQNSIDAVSDRDFVLEIISAAAIAMMHLSRLSEELILWSSSEFSFIDLDDAYCTGSSMMPQKKNPDVLELIRGKSGRAYGALISLLTLMKSLPLAYNRDMQEDKIPLFDSVKTLEACWSILIPVIETMKVNQDVMKQSCESGELLATAIADYLVEKQIAFREAHAIVGNMILFCTQNKKLLRELTLSELKNFSAVFSDDFFELFNLEHTLERYHVIGGPSKSSLELQIVVFEKKNNELQQWLTEKFEILENVYSKLLGQF